MRQKRALFAGLIVLSNTALFAAYPISANAAVTKTELAGNALTVFPFFNYVKAINANESVKVAIDPTRFPGIVNKTCDIYVVAAKKTLGWNGNNSLTDITAGGMQTQTFNGPNIQANTFQVATPSELSGNAGTGLGVGYDVVLDCNQNGQLDNDDFIDGRNNESGFYVVNDTSAAGPIAVTQLNYNLSSIVGSTFGVPGTHLAENLFYPTNIASLGQLPLIVISHGNGHNYAWYSHLGNHLASYGYIVMSHANNTGPGTVTASTTTLGHTDAFINQAAAGAIAGGALVNHVDADRIVWIGHSRGAEGVAIAYDRIFDATHIPVNFTKSDIKLISSMLPTDFSGTAVANPHDANYHLWTASGDSDVNGSAGCELCQTYHLHDRAVGHRQSTSVQGTGHGWFHNGGGNPWFAGPCSIGQANTHLIELGYFLPLIKRYVDDNIPSIDFLTRQYESFRPIGVPTNDSCIVVSNEYFDASGGGTVIFDNYQTATATTLSSIGGAVTFDVNNLTENKLDDNNSDFSWSPSDSFNGATQAGNTGGVYTDTSRGVVFDWTGTDKFYEWQIPVGEINFADNLFLSLRGAQGTQHPNTIATAGDLTFTVTLRDSANATSSINIGAYGGGFERPYQRGGGWHNEMETVRIRLSDFLNNGSGVNLGSIVAVRLNVGPSWGSPQGRIVIDDLALSNDRAVYDGADNGDPHIHTVNGINYDFQSAGEFTLLRDGDMEIQARQTPVPSAPPVANAHTGLASCVSVNTAVAARVGGHRVTYQPSLNGEANPEGMQLRVDGKLIDINSVPYISLGAGGRVAKLGAGSGIEIDFPDGTTLRAVPGWWGSQNMWYVNFSVVNTPATEGIMGLVHGGDWLPRLPDDTSMGPRPLALADRHNALNKNFADAWRVTKADSMFDYAKGMTTDSFTNPDWPKENATSCDLPNTVPVKPADKSVAEKACRPVLNVDDRENCRFDVAQTGETGFGTTYFEAQKLDFGSTKTEVYKDRKKSDAGRNATFVAIVRHKKSGERVQADGEKVRRGAVQFTLDGKNIGEPVGLDAFGQAKRRITNLRNGKRRVGATFIPTNDETVFLTSTSIDLLYAVGDR
jgi:Platelet-activating factor acetylhydrolase, isoform II